MALKDEMVAVTGVSAEQTITNADNTHPVIRFPGPRYSDDSRQVAYRWLAEKLAALTPIVRKALGIRG